MKKEDVPQVTKQIYDDKILELYSALSDIHQRNESVNKTLTESITCENPKVLEVLMEHIVLNWDEIVQLLIDELIHEEV